MKTKLGEGPLAWSAFILIVWISTVLVASHLSGLKSYHNAYEDAYRESTQHNKYNAAERKCRASISPSKAVDCIIEAEKADRERHNAEQDLNAQRQMADWAWAMMWATIATTLITALGVILIAVTLLYTRNTLDLAQSTNDAAWETVTGTREIGEKQVKAYVTCTGAKFLVEDNLIWLDVFLKNTGNSPAFNIEIVGTFSAFVLGRHPEHTKNVRIDVTGGSCGVISASGEDTGFLFASRSSEGSYSVEQFDELIEIVDHLGSTIRISWTDVFENTQHEWFVLDKPRGSDTRGAGGGDIIAQGKLASHHQTQHHQNN